MNSLAKRYSTVRSVALGKSMIISCTPSASIAVMRSRIVAGLPTREVSLKQGRIAIAIACHNLSRTDAFRIACQSRQRHPALKCHLLRKNIREKSLSIIWHVTSPNFPGSHRRTSQMSQAIGRRAACSLKMKQPEAFTRSSCAAQEEDTLRFPVLLSPFLKRKGEREGTAFSWFAFQPDSVCSSSNTVGENGVSLFSLFFRLPIARGGSVHLTRTRGRGGQYPTGGSPDPPGWPRRCLTTFVQLSDRAAPARPPSQVSPGALSPAEGAPALPEGVQYN